MTAETILLSLHLSAPEIILAVGALVLLMIGVFAGERSGPLVTTLAIIVLLVSGLWLLVLPADGLAFGGVYMADGFSRFMKLVALVGSLVAIFMSIGHARENQLDKFEYPVLLVLATLGFMLLYHLSSSLGRSRN